MTQINLGNVLPLPEVSRDQYSCWEENLSVQVDMISIRRVGDAEAAFWHNISFVLREERPHS